MNAKATKLAMTGRFYLEFQVKAVLCFHFYRDAMDWLALYQNSLECEYTSLSIRTKQFIHLRMALECMLKALLICLAKKDEKPEDAYAAARKCSHNLEKLVKACKKRSAKRYRICTKAMLGRFQKVDALGIGIRYDLDMKTAYKMQTPIEIFTESGPVTSVLLDYDFHKTIWQDIVFVQDVYDRVSDRRLAKHRAHLASKLGAIEAYVQRIVQ